MKVFKISNDTHQIKMKLMLLSGISLFLGLTKSLPEKVAIIGLDLSKNPTITGWFILFVSTYFMLKFLVSSMLELFYFKLPHIITIKTKETTGNILGLTAEECLTSLGEQPDDNTTDSGTPNSELDDINVKNIHIKDKYKKIYVILFNTTAYTVDIILPVILWGTGSTFLYLYLKSIN